MARIRTIKPAFARHEHLQELETSHAKLRPMLTFCCLWTQCDREGRFEWRPRMLKLDILPFVQYDIAATLDLLAEHGYIVRYQACGKEYGYIPTWKEHQCPNVKEAASQLPVPPEHVPAPCQHVSSSGEVEVERSSGNEYSAEASPAQVVITLPLNDGTEHPVTEPEISEWQKLYPIADVLQELRNMRGWLIANKPKRKTKTGINKFINAWLARVQDKGGPSNVNPGVSNGTGKAQQRQDASIDAIRTAVTRMAGGSHGEYEGPIPEPGDYSRDGASVAGGLEADGPAIRR